MLVTVTHPARNPMYKMLLLAIMIFGLMPPVFAQDTPKVEVSGAYSYQRRSGLNYNGWHGSIDFPLRGWIGIEGSVSGLYKSLHYGASGGDPAQDYNFALYHILIGPLLSYRNTGSFTPFAHALAGAWHSRFSTDSPYVFIQSQTYQGFALGIGGGLDLRINDMLALRMIQADYLHEFGHSPSSALRLCFGLVFRLGEK
jgi:opacity protein-like surface antigen